MKIDNSSKNMVNTQMLWHQFCHLQKMSSSRDLLSFILLCCSVLNKYIYNNKTRLCAQAMIYVNCPKMFGMSPGFHRHLHLLDQTTFCQDMGPSTEYKVCVHDRLRALLRICSQTCCRPILIYSRYVPGDCRKIC